MDTSISSQTGRIFDIQKFSIHDGPGIRTIDVYKRQPIAKSLIGKRSAVVIKTPHGNVREQILPAGEIYIEAEKDQTVNIDAGADAIMQALAQAGEIRDIRGQEPVSYTHLTTVKNSNK